MGMEQKRIQHRHESAQGVSRETTAGGRVPMDPVRTPDIPGRLSLWEDNRGVGVVEMILILVVLIALVIIFKTQLTSLVKTIFNTITKNANTVLK